ncbi:hypothetical protein DFH29DRAFT_815012 [Suillus ampliporus]|nr:hypothetical protein DFH29DRAFT_815012 [Suillus ampliporus]
MRTQSCRLLPDKMSNNLHSAWKALIPTLVDAHLQYSARTHGTLFQKHSPVISACTGQHCAQRQFSIICLFFDRKSFICLSGSG